MEDGFFTLSAPRYLRCCVAEFGPRAETLDLGTSQGESCGSGADWRREWWRYE